jgi:hypothetical protein
MSNNIRSKFLIKPQRYGLRGLSGSEINWCGAVIFV